MNSNLYDKAAERGVPSCVWRAGQSRRLDMITKAAEYRLKGRLLVDGCGVGTYLSVLTPLVKQAVGIDIEYKRVHTAQQKSPQVACSAGEALPFKSNSFDLVLSHEVLEHVADDRLAMEEIIRSLKPGGRLLLFCPNRGYPFETHGIYIKKKYHFGNIPLVNYLPRKLRDRFAPHVRVYRKRDVKRLFDRLPIEIISSTVIFGAYDNVIARWPVFGKTLRWLLYLLERTPLRVFGLSHFFVVEKRGSV